MTEKDIYSNGVALLEEWEDVNYCEHSFKFKDEWLTDKEVVDLLNELDEKYVDEFALRETLQQELQRSEEENEQLKASLYAEKTNTAEVVNDYSKQFKRHSAQFSFMMDLADDLGVDVATLEALDD